MDAQMRSSEADTRITTDFSDIENIHEGVRHG
jgi:hypothetical protein